MGLTGADALAMRMSSLLLREHPAGARDGTASVGGIVTWFGAMQAQDLASGLWSFGARLPGHTVDDVTAALERREALRTWPMRGTVHFVPPRDAKWMLDVTGSLALAGAQARREFLGLTKQTADQAVDVLATALSGNNRLTRSQCVQALVDAGIDGAGQLGYHLLWYASQRGVTCIAPNIGKEQSFVLLDEWVPEPHRPDRDEALATLAVRYFRSHGPTTRKDFAGWTGMSAADAKLGIAAAGDRLATVDVDGVQMLADPALLDAYRPGKAGAGAPDDVLTLAGFDEYMLGFKDRSLMLDAEHKKALVPGNNGVFQWTVVRGGRVVGTWKRAITRTRLTVTVHPLTRLTKAERGRTEHALAQYATFLNQPLTVTFSDTAQA